MLTGYASVRHVEVSLPIVEAILDGEKYYIERKRLEGTEIRAEADTEIYSRTSLIASGRHCLNCIDKLRY